MTVEFLIPWRHFSQGHVTDQIPGGQADVMIRRGIVKEITVEATAGQSTEAGKKGKKKLGAA